MENGRWKFLCTKVYGGRNFNDRFSTPIRDALMNDYFNFIHTQEEEKKKKNVQMAVRWSLQARRFKITQRTQKRFR